MARAPTSSAGLQYTQKQLLDSELMTMRAEQERNGRPLQFSKPSRAVPPQNFPSQNGQRARSESSASPASFSVTSGTSSNAWNKPWRSALKHAGAYFSADTQSGTSMSSGPATVGAYNGAYQEHSAKPWGDYPEESTVKFSNQADYVLQYRSLAGSIPAEEGKGAMTWASHQPFGIGPHADRHGFQEQWHKQPWKHGDLKKPQVRGIKLWLDTGSSPILVKQQKDKGKDPRVKLKTRCRRCSTVHCENRSAITDDSKCSCGPERQCSSQAFGTATILPSICQAVRRARRAFARPAVLV